mmetsp:Transcript_81574/g.243228  ORF Transcript_81574/g.243228 Transcript_81574/m.243228 type:complete len:273 (+) Transcript_81574:44-862(+)
MAVVGDGWLRAGALQWLGQVADRRARRAATCRASRGWALGQGRAVGGGPLQDRRLSLSCTPLLELAEASQQAFDESPLQRPSPALHSSSSSWPLSGRAMRSQWSSAARRGPSRWLLWRGEALLRSSSCSATMTQSAARSRQSAQSWPVADPPSSSQSGTARSSPRCQSATLQSTSRERLVCRLRSRRWLLRRGAGGTSWPRTSAATTRSTSTGSCSSSARRREATRTRLPSSAPRRSATRIACCSSCSGSSVSSRRVEGGVPRLPVVAERRR